MKEKILELLKQVQDPDLKRDIVSLGMVREIKVESQAVTIYLAVTSSSQRMHQQLTELILEKLRPSVQPLQVHVEISKAERQSAAFMPKTPLPGVQHVIAVSSGKGGVGKTTVSVNLSCALLKLGYRVGLMDGDIYGPNVPMMLGVPSSVRPEVSEDEKLIPIQAHGLKMISMGVLVPADQPMVWRGPMLHGAVTQFLQKVEWGNLDFLVVDLPPGTGDVQLSLVQTVPLTGAVMVTTPQEVALLDVRKGIAMFQKTQVPILGVIENMTGEMFGSGGGKKLAEQYQVPLLGEIPLEVLIRKAGDAGSPVVISSPDSPVAKAFLKAAESLVSSLSAVQP